jgi:anaerobic magnesium-protoporphyrin IX monomethyl ester cyclase
MSISAMLKQQGHDVQLLLADEEGRNLESNVYHFHPDYLLMPVITGEHDWVSSIQCQLYSASGHAKLVIGGPHVTYYPETVQYADYIIRGEADNLWGALQNPPGEYLLPPVEDITKLPQPDRSIYYDRYPHLAKASSRQFLTARGCPYGCAFCSNHLTHRMFPDAPLIRRREPLQVINEILGVRRQWGLKTVSFTDDVFTLNNDGWLSHFLLLYKRFVNLPFICNTRFDIFNDELASKLKDAGCYGVEMGVESGVQRIRAEILGKGNKPNETIIKAGEVARKYRLKLKTYNIIGIPGETFDDAMETVHLNQKLHADQTSCSFMTPFPKYDIAKHYPEGTVTTSSIYQPGKWVPREIVNLQTFFFILVKAPWLEGLVRKLCKLPPNPLFRTIALGVYGLFMARVHRLTVGDIWRYVRHIKPERI